MKKLGVYLRENREAKGITLEEIERVSNISVSQLRALEEGQAHLLPAQTFTIGFLKQYARCLGLDPEDVVLRYRTAARQEGAQTPDRAIERVARGRRRSIWILAGSLLVLGLLWVLLYPGADRTGERVRSIRVPRASLKEIKKQRLREELGLAQEVSPETVPDAEAYGGSGGVGMESLPGAGSTGGVEVIVQALEATKIQVLLDDGPGYEKTLDRGDRHPCRAENRVKLQIKNGSGVRIFYGGKVYENLGKKGEVVHIRFPPAGAG